MSKNKLKKIIKDHFKPQSVSQRIWCRHFALPFAERIVRELTEEIRRDLQNEKEQDMRGFAGIMKRAEKLHDDLNNSHNTR